MLNHSLIKHCRMTSENAKKSLDVQLRHITQINLNVNFIKIRKKNTNNKITILLTTSRCTTLHPAPPARVLVIENPSANKKYILKKTHTLIAILVESSEWAQGPLEEFGSYVISLNTWCRVNWDGLAFHSIIHQIQKAAPFNSRDLAVREPWLVLHLESVTAPESQLLLFSQSLLKSIYI